MKVNLKLVISIFFIMILFISTLYFINSSRIEKLELRVEELEEEIENDNLNEFHTIIDDLHDLIDKVDDDL